MTGVVPVLVGRPGDLVPVDGLVDAYATRVGGTPVLPAGCHAMPELNCTECNERLVLLLQAHAPLPGAPSRFLYVMGCAASKCPGSWRVLRCQPPSTTAPPSTEGEAQQPEASSLPQAPATEEQEAAGSWGGTEVVQDTWGAAAADWDASDDGSWGAEPSAPADAAAFDFDDLNAALDAVQSVPAAPRAAAPPPRLPATAPAPDAPGAPLQRCYAAACLPSFYLVAEPEPQAAGKPSRKEREHLQQLLAQYEQEAGGCPAEAAGSSADAAAAAAGACLPSIEGTAESWSGEGYERDAVLHADKARAAGLCPAFIKFSKRLAACPDQCARYSFGGVPLWPGDAPPAPQPCAQCGAPAVFESQLMAPAIHYLEESADWLEEERGGSEEEAGAAGQGPGLRPPHSWEWATVAVYSCSRSCAPGAGGFMEEQAFVGNE